MLLPGAVGLVLLAVGCTDPSGNDPNVPDRLGAVSVDAAAPPGCTPALPATCPNTPSYAENIAPLVKRTCVPCHAPGGKASDRDFTTYHGLVRLETTALTQVNGCLMPPADAGPDAAMSLGDRTELLQWFVCGSPDN